MLQVRSSHKMAQVEAALRRAAQRHRASIHSAASLGQLLRDKGVDTPAEAFVFTILQPGLDAALLAAEIRFSVWLPCRVAAYAQPEGAILEAVSPRELCALFHRPDLDLLAGSIETSLREILEEASRPLVVAVGAAASPDSSHWSLGATEDQVSMRGTLPQRIDKVGSKVEDLAGTGKHDSPGG